MNLPTTIIPAKPRVSRKRRRQTQSPAVAEAPVLTAAEFFTDDGAYVMLTFDRAVALDDPQIGAFIVLRHPSTEAYSGNNVWLIDPNTVKVEVGVNADCDEGPDVVMSVASNNGIVAVDGGTEWAGATDVVLPFG
jgi:hypothetical protein